jgi:hypothetical protein
MEVESFVASRWTRGNLLFPTRIVVGDQSVTRRKRSWLTLSEESIHIRNVASVLIKTGLIWSELCIESSGGKDPIQSHGHTKGDARRIKELIEARQALLGAAPAPAPAPGAGTTAAPAGTAGQAEADTKSCPFCAETIKQAARVCRYCGRTLD